jgi:hypothetical protein
MAPAVRNVNIVFITNSECANFLQMYDYRQRGRVEIYLHNDRANREQSRPTLLALRATSFAHSSKPAKLFE